MKSRKAEIEVCERLGFESGADFARDETPLDGSI
jgi:hypothetical protein